LDVLDLALHTNVLGHYSGSLLHDYYSLNSDAPNIVVSIAVVGPLLVVYITLLPRSVTRGRFLPHIDDFEKAVTRLSWMTVAALVLALNGRTLVRGVSWNETSFMVVSGLLKALSWYFVAKTVCMVCIMSYLDSPL
jgi:hypothetical protein